MASARCTICHRKAPIGIEVTTRRVVYLVHMSGSQHCSGSGVEVPATPSRKGSSPASGDRS
jgi:hypothetical protein